MQPIEFEETVREFAQVQSKFDQLIDALCAQDPKLREYVAVEADVPATRARSLLEYLRTSGGLSIERASSIVAECSRSRSFDDDNHVLSSSRSFETGRASPSRLSTILEQYQQLWNDKAPQRAKILRALPLLQSLGVTGLVYIRAAVRINIKNPTGDATIDFFFHAYNGSSQPVLGEQKSIWFEHGQASCPDIEPYCTSRRFPLFVELHRPYSDFVDFFVNFGRGVKPGQVIRYGYRLRPRAMFRNNHYWDTKMRNLTHRLEVGVTHNKGQRLQSCRVECTTQNGRRQLVSPDLSLSTRGGIAAVRFARAFPEWHAKYSLYWAFQGK